MNRLKEAYRKLSRLGRALGGSSFRVQESIFKIFLAKTCDAEVVKSILHDGFRTWTEKGLEFSPGNQTLEATVNHIEGNRGFLVRENGLEVATFSLMEAVVSAQGQDLVIRRPDGDSRYSRPSSIDCSYKITVLILQRISILRDRQNVGIGLGLLCTVEQRARESGFEAVLLETSPNASWLYEWYMKQDYELVAEGSANANGIVTNILLKRI